jgi:type IV pilus assembly protein PilA
MLRFFNKRLHNRKGFTLIELIVVIAILGILALIAIPRFVGTLENSKLRAHQSNIKVIESAINLYQAENAGTMPANNAALTATYVTEWPTKPGTYTVANGVLTANPTKAATETALAGGDAVVWP